MGAPLDGNADRPGDINRLDNQAMLNKALERMRADSVPNAPENTSGGYGAVAGTVGSGALKELTEHPVKLGAIAVGTGVATELATAFLKKPTLYTLGAAGLAWGGYKLYENAPSWIKSADVVAHGANFTPAERLASQKVLSDLGRGSMDLAAGGLGGGLAKPLAGLGRAGLARLQSTEVAGALEGQAVKASGGLKDVVVPKEAPPAVGYVRNDNIQVPTGVYTESESEGVVYFRPDNTIVKVKMTAITSAEEEANALASLGRQGIRVPRVFEVGKTAEGHEALTMETIPGDTYRDVVLSGDKNRLTAAMHDFQRQIAIMQKTGVAADDIQFKNIIIGPAGEVHFIDPLRLVAAPNPLKVNRILENMVLNGARQK
ncbi:MAG: hypothetical protein JSS83_28310 [Cyanobacteria bacterium SZAS LIN-3]|nr:hypothetical protein [Cyanobacteria bacterium SZAS LIN-3]MBS2008325.1 hypothetical protein [Cyanobacteria bacterium SZAS TMP-1]